MDIEAKDEIKFTEIDFQIKKEIEVFIKRRNPDELVVSAMIGSWKETQTDEEVLEMLKSVNLKLQQPQ